MNIFKDNNDYNEKSIIGAIAFAIMCLIMIADLVTGWIGKDLIINTDLLVENIHFSEGTTTPEDIGWKAIASNVSDLICSGSGKILMRSAPTGTGIIAGGATRSVCEVLGIQDIVAKSLGSPNPHNVLKAVLKGLKNQSSPKVISAMRNKKIAEIIKKREK